MQFTIDGIRYDFMPIRDFRAIHQLPATFNISLFESKDYTGLGRIDAAGAALHQLHDAVIAALPAKALPLDWLSLLPDVTHSFETQLYQINDQIGLRDVEIEFAVAGFSDALQAYAYAFVYAHSTHTPLPDFISVYSEWLNGTVKAFAQEHTYIVGDESCTVQVVAHAYGRIGLLIHASQTYAIYDPALACPAEGFMTQLLIEIAAHMRQVSS
ncbi:MAG: hypothetical protein GC179_13195 [Anaerolineaceae bacterium]|nr:hypothetical protein [Anaerolineaceae bacterium]